MKNLSITFPLIRAVLIVVFFTCTFVSALGNTNNEKNLSTAPCGTTATIIGESKICEGSSTTLTAEGGILYDWGNGFSSNTSITVSPLTTTTYVVTVQDANNCTATASKTISVLELPSVIINYSPDIDNCLPAGSTITLTASAPATITEADGYEFIHTQEDYIELVNPTILKQGTGDDMSSTLTIPDGFTIKYNGENLNRLNIADGQIRLGNNSFMTPYDNKMMASLNHYNIIAPFLSDLYLTANGSLSYEMQGSSPERIFVIQFKNVSTYADHEYFGDNYFNFQVKLYENGTIQFCYGDGMPSIISCGESDGIYSCIGINTGNGNVTKFIQVTPSRNGHIAVSEGRLSPITANETRYIVSGTTYTFVPDEIGSFPSEPDFLWSTNENSQSITVSPTTTSEYTITITNRETGCSESTTANISITPNPTILGPEETCIGSETTLTANCGILFDWGNGFDESDSINIMPKQDTTIIVTIKDIFGCIGTTSKNIRIQTPNIQNIQDGDFVWADSKPIDELGGDWNDIENWLTFNNSEYKPAQNLPTNNSNVFITNYGNNCITHSPTIDGEEEALCNNIYFDLDLTIFSKLYVSGDWSNKGNIHTTKSSIVEFNGRKEQHMTSSVKNEFCNIKINNSSATGIYLPSTTTTILYDADFTEGVVFGDLTFGPLATSSNSSINSFVDGKVTKNYAASDNYIAFTFPTGNVDNSERIFANLSGSVKPVTEKSISVQYFHNNEGFSTSEMPDWWEHGNNMCASEYEKFHHVSNLEFWEINSDVEIIDATISWNGGIHHSSVWVNKNIGIAYYQNSCWENLGDRESVISDEHHGSITIAAIPNYESRNLNNYLTFGSVNPETLLPITLTDFYAECNNTDAEITWITASEVNNDYFVLEKSADAQNFVEIAKINGAGNSIEENTYSYFDNNLFDGDNYYRLKQVDFDGHSSTSEIISLNCQNPEIEMNVDAFPNPVEYILTLTLREYQNKLVNVDVYNSLGDLIEHTEIESALNNFEVNLDFRNYKPANYIVRISTNDNVISKNVIKVN